MPSDFLRPKQADEPETRWFRLPVPDMEPEERPRLQVRAIPATRRRELYYRRFGKNQKIHERRGVRIVKKEDNDRWDAFTLDIAVEALVDSKGLSLALPEETATKLTEHMGSVVPDEWVCFDGKWTEPVRRIVLELLADVRPSLVRWIFDHAQKIVALEDDEEEELGKT